MLLNELLTTAEAWVWQHCPWKDNQLKWCPQCVSALLGSVHYHFNLVMEGLILFQLKYPKYAICFTLKSVSGISMCRSLGQVPHCSGGWQGFLLPETPEGHSLLTSLIFWGHPPSLTPITLSHLQKQRQSIPFLTFCLPPIRIVIALGLPGNAR